MPDIPTALRPFMDALAGDLSDELLQAWVRGVCDGLEFAARMAENLLPHLVPGGDPSPEHEVVLGLVMAIRQSQARVLVDGLFA